jgi:hypothetical protein
MKRFQNIFVLVFAAIGLTSCLDEQEIFDPKASPNVIEFASNTPIKSPLSAVHPLYVNSFEIKPEGAELPVVISYSGGDVAPTDIEVTITLDEAALARYNDWNNKVNDPGDTEADFTMLPANLYNLPTTTVTIPKGERTATVNIKMFTEQFDLTQKYALPLTITKASSGILSGNHATAIFSVGAKNKYDGLYSVTGTMVDANNAAFTGYYPKEISLVTIDGNTVEYYDEGFHLNGHIFSTGTSLSYYGSFLAQFNFDAQDNVESVVNAYGQTAGGNQRGGILITPAVNKMTFEADGTPKTLEVKYAMTQFGNVRTTWTETYTYVGPRP